MLLNLWVIKIATYISLFFFLLACKDKETKIVDLDEIISYSEEDDSQLKEQSDLDSNAILLAYFNENGIDVDRAEIIENNLLPSRFGPVHKKAFELTDSTSIARYFQWTFRDSVKVMNAFYNWMDCYGPKCSSIYLGEERLFQKGSMLILVGDTTLAFVEGDDIRFSDWYGFHDSLNFDPEWNFAVEQRSGHRARWYTYTDDKKLKYERP
jgi:hypothetical protein